MRTQLRVAWVFPWRSAAPAAVDGLQWDCYWSGVRGGTWIALALLGSSCTSFRESTGSARASSPVESAALDGTAEARSRRGSLDERVDVGDGLKLHIQCEGEGLPPVVFDSGLGQGAEAWSRVWKTVASFTRACIYDRANHGSSGTATVPHSNREMARELFALLANADQAAPYVLVGHSMGGTNVQLFLEEHEDSVAGMVLIDASPEPPPIDRIPPAAMAEFERNIEVLEGLDLQTLMAGFDELRASTRSLGSKPLAILVAGRILADPNINDVQAKQFLAERQQAQSRLLRLSTNSVLVIAENSAHHIPDEDPKIVSRAVHAVVEGARTGKLLSASAIQDSVEFQ